MGNRANLAWLVLGAVALTGCHSCKGLLTKKSAPDAATPDADAPLPTSTASATAADAGAPPTAFTRACAKEAEKNHAAFKKAGTRETEDPGHTIQCDNDDFDLCVPDSETSGWTIAVDDNVSISGNSYFDDCKLTWNLVYLDIEKGTRLAKSFKGEATFNHQRPKKMIALEAKTVFLLREHTSSATTIPAYLDEGAVYVVKDGKITTDPRFKGNIVDARDIDKDGQLELVLESPFVISRFGHMGMNVASVTMGPTPAAHRIDGGYSFDDATAKRLVRAECPAKEPVLAEDGDVDRWLPCARFWNVPAAQIAKELRKRCNAYIETGTYDQASPDHDAGECPDYLHDWMTLQVPWTLESEP